MPVPKKGVAYTFNCTLFSVANAGEFQVNPTLATGDFQLSKDSGTFTNLTNLPTVVPAGGVQLQVVLTATEMNADRVSVLAIDQAGGEWGPLFQSFDTTVQTIDDVPTAIANADALLKRDWTAITGGPPAYSVWNALRALRNTWAVIAGAPPVQHVKEEDGTTDAWTRNLTVDGAAQPITGAN
jgi:hypothetical protein